ncbi:MAG: hypothetical protein ACJAZT_000596 [Gammaproteobacteria bacterium]|jgi:hypothetical protein
MGVEAIKIEAFHLLNMMRAEDSDPKRNAEKAKQLMIEKCI